MQYATSSHVAEFDDPAEEVHFVLKEPSVLKSCVNYTKNSNIYQLTLRSHTFNISHANVANFRE